MFLSRKQPDDRRFVSRQEVAYRLDVVASNGRHGCVLDLSQGGMRVRHKPEEDVSSAEKMTIELPRWLDLGRELRVRGRCVWTRTTESGAIEAGFAFDGLSRKDEGILTEVLRRLAQVVAEDRPRAPVVHGIEPSRAE